MRKLLFVIATVFVLWSLSAQDVEPVRKVWNDGTTDYIPLGTEFQLKADNWNEDSGIIVYTYNAGVSTEYKEPVPLMDEGPIVISWATQDLWGNISNAKTYSAIVDGTAPEVKFLVSGPSYVDSKGVFYVTEETGVQLFGEDELSGTEHIFVRLNDGAMEEIAKDSFIYLTDRQDGAVNAECVAVDYVGNASEKFVAYLYLDNSAPEVFIDIDMSPVEINGVQYVSPSTKFNLTATDKLSGVEGIYLSMDGAEFAKYDATKPLMATTAGEHVLQVYAKDNLGNVSEISEMSFNTRLTLPPANLFLNVKNQTSTEVEETTDSVSNEK